MLPESRADPGPLRSSPASSSLLCLSYPPYRLGLRRQTSASGSCTTVAFRKLPGRKGAIDTFVGPTKKANPSIEVADYHYGPVLLARSSSSVRAKTLSDGSPEAPSGEVTRATASRHCLLPERSARITFGEVLPIHTSCFRLQNRAKVESLAVASHFQDRTAVAIPKLDYILSEGLVVADPTE